MGSEMCIRDRSRNPNLAALFYRMRLIESFGTGVGKIQRLYTGMKRTPIFETAKGVFRVTLPNQNEDTVMDELFPDPSDVGMADTKRTLILQKELIMEYVSESGQITRKEAEELLQSGSTKAFRLLKELCTEGRLRVEGNGKQSKYVLRRM